MGKQDDFDITARSITNKVTGSIILFRGIKAGSGMQTANLKSIEGVTTWVLDEAEELQDEPVFDDIDESIRTLDNVNRVILIMNPRTKAHFIFRKFFLDNGVNGGWNGSKGDVTYIHTTYLDNLKYLAKSWIDKANKLKLRRPEEYKNRFLGGWLDKAKGAVFTNWQLGEFKKTDAYGFGQDYGFSKDATTLIEVSVDFDKEIIYAKERFYKHHLKTNSIYELNSLNAGDELIIADRAEGRLIDELYDLGNNIEPCEKPPGSVAFGIKLIQGFDLVIDPDSKNLIEELQNYQWLSNKDGVPMDKWNHCIDALRYIVYYLNNDRESGEYYFD